MKQATFVMEPRILLPHMEEWQFIGPDVVEMRPGEWWLFTHWGRNPTDFSPNDPRAANPFSVLKSRDGGATWGEDMPAPSAWNIDGSRSDGGISALRLKSGKRMLLSHRQGSRFHRSGSHGVPVMSVSEDNGATWTPWRCIHDQEEEYYVMNHRLVQLPSGRLLLPVSVRDPGIDRADYREGSKAAGRCFISDDEGETWRLSDWIVQHTERGVAEPCVASIGGDRVVMLFRSGLGCHQICRSEDGGQSWSEPGATPLTAACSPLTLERMPDGRLLLLYNHAKPLFPESFYPRNPLVYATSADGGLTWSEPTAIDNSPGFQVIYPTLAFTDKGILVIYSAHYDHGDGSFTSSKETVLLGGAKWCILDGNL